MLVGFDPLWTNFCGRLCCWVLASSLGAPSHRPRYRIPTLVSLSASPWGYISGLVFTGCITLGLHLGTFVYWLHHLGATSRDFRLLTASPWGYISGLVSTGCITLGLHLGTCVYWLHHLLSCLGWLRHSSCVICYYSLSLSPNFPRIYPVNFYHNINDSAGTTYMLAT